ncbi:Glycoprotein 3-alpha-L-fucosyltransferase A [Echinococcus granulosus]|uniref:Fucosyltransferase n=1 Tax=Echinococcus granulosus TaxID=6210 RepID=W6UDN9_ECHGR|nr:Glycoprotein 3-alpha-L-fucosyltransferase A [Echinococcus granulosus]EUB59168.1 Glycoprotein 3-alpha-L-fucosyltransferase A [Echinococcus granulosus]
MGSCSIDYKPQPYIRMNFPVSLNDVLFVEDFISAQNDEWTKDVQSRHCPSGILSPSLATMNQIILSNHSNIDQAGSIPVIFFDTRVLWPKFNRSLPSDCPYHCIYTNSTEEATNASIAVFTRAPTRQHAAMFKNTLWAFDSNEAPIRMSPIHQEYRQKFSIFLTSNPNSTVSKPYGLYWAYNQPECVMSRKEREHLFHHVDSRHLLPSSMGTKTRVVAWLVSNMYAMNQRKLFVAQLRRHISSTEAPIKRRPLSPFSHNVKRNDMVPIVMGGRPDDYFNLAPPNSYIHVDDFHSPAHLAEYLRYLDGNDTAYAAFFAWKALGTIRKASMTFCRLCALYHHGYLQQQGSSGGGVHLGHFEEHLNPWNLCIGARKWPSIANSALLSGRPLSLLFYLLFCLPVINWCLRSRA